MAKHTRGRIGEEGGPPPWISFGQKIQRSNLQEANFKVSINRMYMLFVVSINNELKKVLRFGFGS